MRRIILNQEYVATLQYFKHMGAVNFKKYIQELPTMQYDLVIENFFNVYFKDEFRNKVKKIYTIYNNPYFITFFEIEDVTFSMYFSVYKIIENEYIGIVDPIIFLYRFSKYFKMFKFNIQKEIESTVNEIALENLSMKNENIFNFVLNELKSLEIKIIKTDVKKSCIQCETVIEGVSHFFNVKTGDTITISLDKAPEFDALIRKSFVLSDNNLSLKLEQTESDINNVKMVYKIFSEESKYLKFIERIIEKIDHINHIRSKQAKCLKEDKEKIKNSYIEFCANFKQEDESIEDMIIRLFNSGHVQYNNFNFYIFERKYHKINRKCDYSFTSDGNQ